MTALAATPTGDIAETWLSRNPLFSFLDRQGDLLSPEQERRLADRSLRGCMRSRNELVERNMRLVLDLARRSGPRDEHDLFDRIQLGSIGLMRAAEKFDPSRGFRFSTYATWWVRPAVSRAREDNNHMGVPAQLTRELRAAERMLAERDGREPTARQVAAEVSIDEDDAAHALASLRPYSLDMTVGGSGYAALGDLIADDDAADPADVMERMDLREQVEQHLRALDTASRRAARLRYGLETGAPETIQSVAEHMGLDPVEARRLTRRAIKTLQDRIDPPTKTNPDELTWPDTSRMSMLDASAAGKAVIA